jgi:hypothetical protein
MEPILQSLCDAVALQPLRALAGAAAGSDEARFLTIGALRARNRVAHALKEAVRAAG